MSRNLLKDSRGFHALAELYRHLSEEDLLAGTSEAAKRRSSSFHNVTYVWDVHPDLIVLTVAKQLTDVNDKLCSSNRGRLL